MVPVGESAEPVALDVLQALRACRHPRRDGVSRQPARRMERANRIGARAAVVIGDDDIAQGVAQVKDLASGEQEAVALADVPRRLR